MIPDTKHGLPTMACLSALPKCRLQLRLRPRGHSTRRGGQQAKAHFWPLFRYSHQAFVLSLDKSH